MFDTTICVVLRVLDMAEWSGGIWGDGRWRWRIWAEDVASFALQSTNGERRCRRCCCCATTLRSRLRIQMELESQQQRQQQPRIVQLLTGLGLRSGFAFGPLLRQSIVASCSRSAAAAAVTVATRQTNGVVASFTTLRKTRETLNICHLHI